MILNVKENVFNFILRVFRNTAGALRQPSPTGRELRDPTGPVPLALQRGRGQDRGARAGRRLRGSCGRPRHLPHPPPTIRAPRKRCGKVLVQRRGDVLLARALARSAGKTNQ